MLKQSVSPLQSLSLDWERRDSTRWIYLFRMQMSPPHDGSWI
jgi:hypothetical protein